MLTQYALIALYSIMAVIFVLSMLLAPVLFKKLGIVKSKPSQVKNSAFECGMETIGKTHVRFNFRYYFYALLFVVLDVLVLFLLPWAAGIRNVGILGLVAVLVMLALIGVGYFYAWKKKAFEWK